MSGAGAAAAAAGRSSRSRGSTGWRFEWPGRGPVACPGSLYDPVRRCCPRLSPFPYPIASPPGTMNLTEARLSRPQFQRRKHLAHPLLVGRLAAGEARLVDAIVEVAVAHSDFRKYHETVGRHANMQHPAGHRQVGASVAEILPAVEFGVAVEQFSPRAIGQP